MLKKLIIVRHGSYGSDGYLTEYGQGQMGRLGAKLKTRIEGKVRVLCSTAPRALQSARLLAQYFGVEVESHDKLWSDEGHPEDVDAALSLIAACDDCDVLIVVTHFEYAIEIPSAYGKKVLGVPNFPRGEVEKGSCRVIDCKEKTCRYVSSEW